MPDPSPLNASDILLNLGFRDAQAVAGALAAWASLIRLVRADALVCDYAPTALLAGLAAGLPRFAVGSGFSTPPVGDPMPSLRPWASVDEGALAQRDARLVASVREAWLELGARAPAPQSTAQIFEADAQLLCTWPEVDPFGARVTAEYLGPQADAAAALSIIWAGEVRPRIFAYLKPRDPRFEAVLAALREVAGEAIVAAPGLDESRAQVLSSARMRVHPAPVALELLASADLCVSHGGPGIVAAAMRHGVPQALLPLHLEQYLVSRRAREAGIAKVLEPDAVNVDARAWLESAVADSSLGQAARPVSQALATRVPASAGAHIARLMES